MILRIDGHEIPIATAEDFTVEELAAHNTRQSWEPDASGHADIEILGVVPGKSVPFNTYHGGDPGSGCTSFTIVPPAGDDDPELNLASLRPVRVVGHSYQDADRDHQRRLFHAVGAITVAGGHVEMALRKVLVSLINGQNQDLASKDASLDWSKLHKKIEELCEDDSSDFAQRVLELLKAAENSKLRVTRNNVVHSYWWLPALDSGEVWGGRYFNRGQEPVNIVDSPEDLLKRAEKLFEFATELEALVTPYWPLAIVPAMDSAPVTDVIDLDARADQIWLTDDVSRVTG